MPTRYYHLRLPEAGLELVYEPDATPPAELIANQFELAEAAADYLSLTSLIKTLESKQQQAEERLVELAGDKIRYIKKRHGRKPRLKAIGLYPRWEIDLDKLRVRLTEAGRPDIYEQSVRRGAPGRFVAEFTEGDREEVISDLSLKVEPLGVQIKSFDRQVEFYVHMPTLRRLCAEESIKLRGVRTQKHAVYAYDNEPAESRK